MGFTTAAFIRRNTPEIRKKLEELGYKKYGNPFQITDGSKLITTIDGEYVPYNVPLDDSFIDCGSNEELFLAIAALRDDTSANQYWVFDQDFPPHYQKGDFTIGHFHRCSCYCHKASVEELMEHFKGKEE